MKGRYLGHVSVMEKLYEGVRFEETTLAPCASLRKSSSARILVGRFYLQPPS